MQSFFRFISNMDARAWRSILVSFVLFGGVGLVFVFGAAAFGLNGEESIKHWMGAGLTGPAALPVAVAGFTLLAFLGAPQFVLIAAAVVAFGPLTGFAYSWIGTEISALIGFALGRRFGADVLRQHGGKGVNEFMTLVGRNGFVASLVVRLVPSAPFIVVNMAAGVTPMKLWDFAFGTALGIIPKIALTAFAGHAVVKGLSGDVHGPTGWLSLVAAVALWLISGLIARAWLKRREAAAGEAEQAESQAD